MPAVLERAGRVHALELEVAGSGSPRPRPAARRGRAAWPLRRG